ncbi:hypothetical protein PAXRUDRAFT_821838 [Paxillus rubicundulus Ve08.2h10]|uniref:DUF1742-domain-containing protein n=1 Tax=Paxillus rubicundulus Ve08.2h10 TaxID=930991 RepID=A0A0D0DN52_9AGAM|nr:hypothetical protein PAXRUDRAFT_821838 [Paxillus rubicundulus Ve08.2h10]
MSFPNLYYKRTAAAAKVCYICYKPTTTVLATIDTKDFLYTCTVHLTDPGFATRVPDLELAEMKQIGASPEEIAKVKEEWEGKQRRKKEAEKDKDREKDTGGKDQDKEAGDGKKAKDSQEKKPESTKAPSASSPRQSTPASKPTHEQYILHRHIFALRVADHRRRRQLAQVKDLAPRLPITPRGTLS